jgi:hypothetical protein
VVVAEKSMRASAGEFPFARPVTIIRGERAAGHRTVSWAVAKRR